MATQFKEHVVTNETTFTVSLPSVQDGDLIVMVFSGCGPDEPMDNWETIRIPWWRRLWWRLTNRKPVYLAVKFLEKEQALAEDK